MSTYDMRELLALKEANKNNRLFFIRNADPNAKGKARFSCMHPCYLMSNDVDRWLDSELMKLREARMNNWTNADDNRRLRKSHVSRREARGRI